MATRLIIFQSERSVHRARRSNDVLIWARHCARVQKTTSFRTAARGEHDEWNFRYSFQGRTGEDQCRADHTLRQRSKLRRRAQVGLAMYFWFYSHVSRVLLGRHLAFCILSPMEVMYYSSPSLNSDPLLCGPYPRFLRNGLRDGRFFLSHSLLM